MYEHNMNIGEASFRVSDGVDPLPQGHPCLDPQWPSAGNATSGPVDCCSHWLLLSWHVLDITDPGDYRELFLPTVPGSGENAQGQIIPCLSRIRAEHVLEHLR